MQGRVQRNQAPNNQWFEHDVSVSYKLKVVQQSRMAAWGNVGMEIGFYQELEIPEIVNQEWNGWTQPLQISIKVNDAIKEAFDTAELGDIFHISIVASYNYSNSNIPYYQYIFPINPFDYVPKPITPNLVFTSPINKDTSVSGFSLLDYIITRDSPGALSFSVFISGGYDQPNLGPGIEVNSNGYVTIYGEGTNTIIVNQAASADKKYAATTTSTQIVVSAPLL